ncbi:BPSS1187 family protein [Gryllotalpicola ginsengisoli]|uniref:BPSS1187 family protein n=1 Tax=Gryllotalpicola ginsengisoli TaxID=444608 RepID=UPI00389924B4
MRRRRRMLRLLALVAAVAALTVAALAWPGRSARAEALISFRLPARGAHRFSPNAPDLAAAAPGAAPLLLFLPATGAQPAEYARFLRQAHDVGYSVLGLDYWNTGPSLARSCEGDMGCYGAMLANRFDGSDPTRFSRVTAADSIDSRLVTALGYLRRHDPAGRWQRYLRPDGDVRWRDLVLAGHSQGGGEAVFIAHRYPVRGVLLFSAPAQSLDGRTADWLSRPGATPASRIWALDDVHDMYAARIAPTWRALGIRAGAPAQLPTGAHGLLTTLRLGDGVQSHSRVVTDRTPLGADHEPVLAPTWRWMLSRPLATGTA